MNNDNNSDSRIKPYQPLSTPRIGETKVRTIADQRSSCRPYSLSSSDDSNSDNCDQ